MIIAPAEPARPPQRTERSTRPLRHGTAAAALLCVAVLTAACAPPRPATTGPTATRTTATTPPTTATPGRSPAAAQYLAIARAGNRHLDKDFDRLEDPDHNHLTPAKADLRDAASTERRFDRRLTHISFPPATTPIAHHLYRANQSRANLTTKAATSTSVRRLHQYLRRLAAANEPVEQDVRDLRHHLGLPPPPTG